MALKQGYKTTEFWLTAVVNIAGAVIAILAGYGIVKGEEGELWLALFEALALAIVPLVMAFVNGRYINARAAVKTASLRAGSSELKAES
jgi:multisubunit Na+/H+ antiporter MnhB subunit